MTRENRLLIAAILCALLAGLLTFRATGEQPASGPVQNVVVAGAALVAGSRLDEQAVSALTISRVPERFAPPGAISDSIDALGSKVLVDLPAGAMLTRSVLAPEGSGDRFRLRPGERALSVEVVASPSGHQFAPGESVDLLASGFGGDQRTQLVIAGAEILLAGDGAAPDRPRLTLRLSAEQVAPVVRADVFAHELRAVQVPGK